MEKNNLCKKALREYNDFIKGESVNITLIRPIGYLTKDYLNKLIYKLENAKEIKGRLEYAKDSLSKDSKKTDKYKSSIDELNNAIEKLQQDLDILLGAIDKIKHPV